MPELAVPGIFVDEQKYTLNSLKIDTRCLTAFVGIAEKGPVNELVMIKSFDDYLDCFGGFDTAGVMPFSVYTYFKCGAQECAVVRVVDEKTANSASIDLKARNGSIRLTARSVGHWGNYLSFRVWQEKERAGSFQTADWENGTWIELNDHIIEENDVIVLTLLGREMERRVQAVEGTRLYLSEPLRLLGRVKDSPENLVIDKAFFSLSVSHKQRVENFLHLSVNPDSDRFFLDYINNRSSLCSITADPGVGLARPVYSVYASGGSDGIASLTAGDMIGSYTAPGSGIGLGCFEGRDDISLVAAPDAIWFMSLAGLSSEERNKSFMAVQRALVEQAERFPGRFAVLDAPNMTDSLGVLSWANSFDTPHAAAYYPFIDVIDPLDPYGANTVRIPPSGAVCGCIVATDGEKGIFHAPANIVVQGAAGVSIPVADAEYEILYPKGINLLKYFPGKGIKIWGARTLSSDPGWRYINVRRTFSRISQSIKRGTQWAVFEPNDRNLRKRVVRQVSGFLLDLWMEGYLSGSTAEQGFYVRCDDELNPPEKIDEGILTIEVGMAIVKPTEFFKIVITAEKEGASVYIDNE